MKGLQEIIRAARSRSGVLATVVRVEGSAYRRPGARMFVPDEGAPIGLVSGGCLEADLAERAAVVARTGEARVAVYDMRSPDDIVWGMGLGCNGEIRVLLERTSADPSASGLGFLEDLLTRRRSGVLVTLFDVVGELRSRPGDRLRVDTDGSTRDHLADPALDEILRGAAAEALRERRSRVRRVETGEGSAEALIEYVPPLPRVLVFGAGTDAVPLVRMAKALGWAVALVDHREQAVTAERFPEVDERTVVNGSYLDASDCGIDAWTFAVVMTHHFVHDGEILEMLLSTAVRYIGLLGPRKRTENLLAELEKRGVDTRGALERIHGPVGLDIGSESPEEIALAILAEIRAVLSGRQGGLLRDGRMPLHDWSS